MHSCTATPPFAVWKKDRKQGIMMFRDNAYRSVITDFLAPVRHALSKDALDDSGW